MILDRRENALLYLGISPELDTALHFVRQLDTSRLETGAKVELDGARVYYMVSEVTLKQRSLRFEYHEKYIDIHLPITGREEIALCSASDRPADTQYDAEHDCGLFDGQAVNVAQVPEGWFCICFPDDAHVPGMGEDGHAIVKIVMKIAAK